MVPRRRGGEHAASRRGRIRIIAMPTMEEVVVAVSMEARGCGRARKHGQGRKDQKSKFPCHDRGSSSLTSEEPIRTPRVPNSVRFVRVGAAGEWTSLFLGVAILARAHELGRI